MKFISNNLIEYFFNFLILLNYILFSYFFFKNMNQKLKVINSILINLDLRNSFNKFCRNGWPLGGTKLWWKHYQYPNAPSLADIFDDDGKLYIILNVRYLNTEFRNSIWKCFFNNQLFYYQVSQTDPLKKTLVLIFNIGYRGNGIISSLCCPILNISFINILFCSISKHNKKQLATACTQTVLKDLNLFRSWILWHNINGFSNLTIYINEKFGIEHLNKYFKIYIEKGIVSFVNWIWPGPKFIDGHNPFFQPASQMSCIYRSRSAYEWVGMHDLDEFFVNPSHKNVKIILTKFLKHNYGSLRVCNQYFQLPNNSLISNVENICSICEFKNYKQIVKPKQTKYFCVHEVSLGGPIFSIDPHELIMAHLKPYSCHKSSEVFKEHFELENYQNYL